MNRKIVAVWMSLAMVLSLIVIVVNVAPPAGGNVIYVGGIGPGNLTTIQEGIDAAISGDTVYVFNGTYYENIILQKQINLIGEDMATTTINGSFTGDVVIIDADGVNVTGFTIRAGGTGVDDAGIKVNASIGCRIYGNNFTENEVGVYLLLSNQTEVTGNSFYNNSVSITSDYSHNNSLADNIGKYIRLEYSHNNEIERNNLVSSFTCIYLLMSSFNNITANDLNGITYGVWCDNSNDNNVIGNNITNGLNGVWQWRSSRYNISNNIGRDCKHVVYSEISGNNEMHSNYFFNCLNGIALVRSDANNISHNFGEEGGTGLSISQSDRNNIVHNQMFNNTVGIHVSSSSYSNYLFENNLSFNKHSGIYMWADGNLVKQNDLISNSVYGIYLYRAMANNISDNKMTDSGISIFSTIFEDWNTHSIDVSNTLNGKPIYYLKNQTDGPVPPGAAQIILANCTNVTIENQEFVHGSNGIEIGFCSGIDISNNTASFNSVSGIFMQSSDGINVSYNTVIMNGESGIYLYFADNNNIIGNYLLSNKLNAFYSRFSGTNNIINNSMCNSEKGLHLKDASMSNTVYGNNIRSNDFGIFLNSSCDNNMIHHNNIINNDVQVFIYSGISSNSYFDDGISGGNYWSDYTGLDDGSGGRIAGDSVGDTEVPHPYTNHGDGYFQLDDYPLMNPIGNYTYLHRGWNLISVPFIQSDTDLGNVLSSITGLYKAVQWYDSTDKNDPWKHYCPSKPDYLNDFGDIEHKMGFWIYITEPGGVLYGYSGTQPTSNQSINLHQGWNLVGYPSLLRYNRTMALNNLTFNVEIDAIWTFKSASQEWVNMGETDFLERGKGYWVHATQECMWEVPL